MSTSEEPGKDMGKAEKAGSGILIGGALLMVLCCAVLPAGIGAAAGSAIGGWIGIVCAVILAGGVALALHRRNRRRGGPC